MTTIHFGEPITGLPPKRDAGTFIGFDADDHPFVLVWSVPASCFAGTGVDFLRAPGDTPTPLHFLCREDMEDFIVRHVRVMVSEEPSE